MNLHKITRVLAIGCLMATCPIGLLTLPWLPGTVINFVELWRSPVPISATENFRLWREAKLHHLEIALTLYALGLLALGGLAAVAAKVLPVWTELLLWLVTVSTALSIRAFWEPSVIPSTDPTAAFIIVRLPGLIAVLAGLAAIMSLTRVLVHRPVAPEL